MSAKRITLTDVAREAGVSVQTASHVLAENMTVRLPERTRIRVKEAALKVGYRPNRLAQAMKSGKTQVIGVLMPVDRPILTYMWFLQAVSALARKDGYEVMITGLEGSMAYGDDAKPPQIWPVDGIMGYDAGKAITALRSDPSNDSIPVSILGFEQCTNGDSVAWDVAGAAKEATQRLIQSGCKRIAHLTLDWVMADYPREQRRRGYSEAMSEAGLEPIFIGAQVETSSGGAAAVDQFLASNPAPDGIFAFNDALAIGAARSLYLSGVEVPAQCKIWGFSDLPEAQDYRVPISSIRNPVAEVVGQGWRWLMERIENPEIEPRMKVLKMELVERDSTKS